MEATARQTSLEGGLACLDEAAFGLGDHTPDLEQRSLAGSTGLEPAASGVTGRRSNQLNYDPKLFARLPASRCALRFQRVGL
jgi:hypothetical protein